MSFTPSPLARSQSPGSYINDSQQVEASNQKAELDKKEHDRDQRSLEGRPVDAPPAYAPRAPRVPRHSTNGGTDRTLHPEHQAGTSLRRQDEVESSSRPRSNQEGLGRGRRKKNVSIAPIRTPAPEFANPRETQDLNAAQHQLHETTIKSNTTKLVRDINQHCTSDHNKDQFQWAKLIPYVEHQTLRIFGNDEIRDDGISSSQKNKIFKQDFVNASKQGSFELKFNSMVKVLRTHAGMSEKQASECLMKCIHDVLSDAQTSEKVLTHEDEYMLKSLERTLKEVEYACDKTFQVGVTKTTDKTLIAELSIYADKVEPKLTSTIPVGDVAFHIFKALNNGSEDIANDLTDEFEVFHKCALRTQYDSTSFEIVPPSFDNKGELSFMISMLAMFLKDKNICRGTENAKATIYFHLSKLSFREIDNEHGDPLIKPQMLGVFKNGLMKCSNEIEQQDMQFTLWKILGCDSVTPTVTHPPHHKDQLTTLAPTMYQHQHQRLQAPFAVKEGADYDGFSHYLENTLPVVTKETTSAVISRIDSTINELCARHQVLPASLDGHIIGWQEITYDLAKHINSYATLADELLSQGCIYAADYSGIFIDPNLDEIGKISRLLKTLIQHNPYNTHKLLINALVKLGRVAEASSIIGVLKDKGKLISVNLDDQTSQSARPNRGVSTLAAKQPDAEVIKKSKHKKLVNSFMTDNRLSMSRLVKPELRTFANRFKSWNIIGSDAHSNAKRAELAVDERADALIVELGKQVRLYGPAVFFRILDCLKADDYYFGKIFSHKAVEEMSALGILEDDYEV